MNVSLTDLVSHADRLVKTARRHECTLLRVLTALRKADIAEYDAGLRGKLFACVAERIGMPEQGVANVFSQHIQRDLMDYEVFLSEHVRRYEKSGISESRISTFLQRHIPDAASVFVMHGMVNIWNPEEQELAWFLVDDVEQTDPLYESTIGYLITRDNVCLTTVDLLDRSYSQRWRNWEILWSKYF